MEKVINIEICVDDAIEALVEAGKDALMTEHYRRLEEKCGLRSMSINPITVDDAIQTLSDEYVKGNELTENQARDMVEMLADNPWSKAELALHCWEEKDTLNFLKERFGNKGYTSNADIIENIADFLSVNA